MENTQQAFAGQYLNKNGEIVELFTGEVITSKDIKHSLPPFNGVFLDKDGERRCLSELENRGGGQTSGRTEIWCGWSTGVQLPAASAHNDGKTTTYRVTLEVRPNHDPQGWGEHATPAIPFTFDITPDLMGAPTSQGHRLMYTFNENPAISEANGAVGLWVDLGWPNFGIGLGSSGGYNWPGNSGYAIAITSIHQLNNTEGRR